MDPSLAGKALASVPTGQASEQDGDDDGAFDAHGKRIPPAWDDSDDDRIAVSIATMPRLRRLRRYEGEDVITGREYIRRLQQQFERLHPRPDWVGYATARANKRKRASEGAAKGDDSDSDDMSVDEDDLSAQPLAKLLRSVERSTNSKAHSGSTRLKFKPEILDIQQLARISSPTQVLPCPSKY